MDEKDINSIINELYLLAQKQGYLLLDYVLSFSIEHSLSMYEIDKVSSGLALRNVMMLDREPNQTVLEDEDVDDYSQSDYENIYCKVISVDSGLKVLVDHVKNTVPAQYGEINTIKYQLKDGNKYARARMIEVHLRRAISFGLDKYEQYNLELADAIQYAIEGLMYAVDKYDPTVNGPFGSYSAMWMWQTLARNRIFNSLVRFPVHVMDALESAFKDDLQGIDFKNLLFDNETINYFSSITGFSNVKSLQFLSLMVGNLSIKYSDFEENTVLQVQNDQTYELYELCLIMLNHLKNKDRKIVEERYGLDGTGRPKTLEEVGALYGITRERVRQIEKKSIQRMSDVIVPSLGKLTVEDIATNNTVSTVIKILGINLKR